MKILFISNHFSLPDQPGAPRPWKIAQYLACKGHDITVITNKRHYLNENIRVVDNEYFTPVITNGIKIVGCDTTRGRRTSISKRIINYFSFSFMALVAGWNVERPDFIIVGTPPLIVPFAGLILGKLHRAFTVLEIRDLYPQLAFDMGKIKNKIFYSIWEKCEDFFHKRYDHIVPVLPGIGRHLIHKGLSPKKITIITNGFDKEHEQNINLPENIESFFQEHSNKCIIVYGGGMGYANNLFTVIQAAELCSDNRKMCFAFFGEGELKVFYQKYIKEKNIKNCYFFQAQPRIIVNEIFRRAYVLIHSYPNKKSFELTLPNKIFEYHGAARPIVFAGKGDTANLIKEAGSGFVVEPENPKKLADVLKYLIENKKQSEIMGKRGYNYIIQNYSREMEFKKWNDIIKKSFDN
jgi:glycosyltransferase involved in cell wall biosynthesis